VDFDNCAEAKKPQEIMVESRFHTYLVSQGGAVTGRSRDTLGLASSGSGSVSSYCALRELPTVKPSGLSSKTNARAVELVVPCETASIVSAPNDQRTIPQN